MSLTTPRGSVLDPLGYEHFMYVGTGQFRALTTNRLSMPCFRDLPRVLLMQRSTIKYHPATDMSDVLTRRPCRISCHGHVRCPHAKGMSNIIPRRTCQMFSRDGHVEYHPAMGILYCYDFSRYGREISYNLHEVDV